MTESPWSSEKVMRRLVGLTKERCDFGKATRGYLILDDTHVLHDKESGKTECGMEGLSWQKVPEGGFANCHTVVTSHWFTPHGHYPVGFRLWSQGGIGKNRLAYWLIKRAHGMGLKFKTVVMDSWYLCPLLMDLCEELDLVWVSRLKSDRAGWVENQKVNILAWFEGVPVEKRQVAVVNGREFTYATRCLRLTDKRKVKVVAAYELGRSKETILIVTNATTWTPESILRAYGYRWSIETFYRDAKQNLGLEAYMLRSVGAVKRHFAMVFVAFTLLQLISHDRRLGRLIAGAVSIGQQTRNVVTQTVGMFIQWIWQFVASGFGPEAITHRVYASRREALAVPG